MILMNTKIWSETVEEAKGKAAGSPAWLRAIEKADQSLRRFSTYWSFDATKGELRIMSGSNAGHLYVITNITEHTCPAMAGGHKVCYHRAAYRLMCRYVERLANAPSNEYMQRKTTATAAVVAPAHQ